MEINKLNIRKELEKLIGREVEVYVDRPIGSRHPKYNDIVYSLNYGYIKEIIALDNEYQDCYVLGIDIPIDHIKGRVYAIIERENDVEDKLVIVTNNKEYSLEQIKQLVNFQEKYFKYKVIK